MKDTILILRDVVLEARTTAAYLEYDDPVVQSLEYIEDMTKRAIEKLGGEV